MLEEFRTESFLDYQNPATRAAMEAAILLGPLAFVAKPAVAATIVKAMGQLVIKYFEDLDDQEAG